MPVVQLRARRRLAIECLEERRLLSGLSGLVPPAAAGDAASAAACEQPGALEAWSAGRTVWHRSCDPVTREWVSGSSQAQGEIAQLTVADGVAAWVAAASDLGGAGTIVEFLAYDPATRRWEHGQQSYRAGETPVTVKLTNAGGIVAWAADWLIGTYGFHPTYYAAVGYAAYDPLTHRWASGQKQYAENTSSVDVALTNADGVVAWVADWTTGTVGFSTTYYASVEYAVYDPASSRWEHDAASYAENTSPIDVALINREGIVAWVAQWSTGSSGFLTTSYASVEHALYDAAVQRWKSGSRLYWETGEPLVVDTAIAGATVSYTVNGKAYTRGYDAPQHAWYAGPTIPQAAFVTSATVGEAPLVVHFWDQSIASRRDWDFGDGETASGPRVMHGFREAGLYTVTATVEAAGGAATAAAIVVTTAGDNDVPNGPWTNAAEPYDVTGEGDVTPRDVLEIIGYLNRFGAGPLPTAGGPNGPPPFLDVNADGLVTALDALQLITYINAQSASGEGESLAPARAEPPLAPAAATRSDERLAPPPPVSARRANRLAAETGLLDLPPDVLDSALRSLLLDRWS